MNSEQLQFADIHIPYPDSESHHLTLRVNGVHLDVKAATVEGWVVGQSSFKRPPGPSVIQEGAETLIAQEYMRSDLTNMFRIASDSPTLDLMINPERGFDLLVDNVGDESKLDLGGLVLGAARLEQKLGRADITFSRPASLERLEVDGQAAPVEITNLSQATFPTLQLTGRNSTYRLSWETLPAYEATVLLEAQDSPTTLTLPQGIAAVIQAADNSPLAPDAKMNICDEFTAHEGGLWTAEALNGLSPRLTIIYGQRSPLTVNMKVG